MHKCNSYFIVKCFLKQIVTRVFLFIYQLLQACLIHLISPKMRLLLKTGTSQVVDFTVLIVFKSNFLYHKFQDLNLLIEVRYKLSDDLLYIYT